LGSERVSIKKEQTLNAQRPMPNVEVLDLQKVGKTNPAATDLKQQPGFQPRKQTLNAQRPTLNAQR
jgi:hypothetical protein